MSQIRTTAVTLAATLALAVCAPNLAGGQVFEVVSIREVPRDAPPLMREQSYTSILPCGQFVDPRITLDVMIVVAFDIPSFTQLTGLPGWAKDQAFSVAAKPPESFPLLPPDKNREQVRAMMREMLASRFHLKLHTESREERILKLKIARGGLKIKPVDPPAPPEKEGFVGMAAGDAGGRMIGEKVTMAGMARALTAILKRPVRDETGLKYYYTFDVKWTATAPVDGQRLQDELGGEGIGALMSALKDLFGLQPMSEMGPIQYWVVDHAERHTAN